MLAWLPVTASVLLFAVGPGVAQVEDHALNTQAQECAAAVKEELQKAIDKTEGCASIGKVCKIVGTGAGVELSKLKCNLLDAAKGGGGTDVGDDLRAKLKCPIRNGAAALTELTHRLCFAAKLSPGTEKNGNGDRKGGEIQISDTMTPKAEFVDGLIAAANVDEEAPDISKLATFLGQADTAARPYCKKYKISCGGNPALYFQQSKLEGDGCEWSEQLQQNGPPMRFMRVKYDGDKATKRTDPIRVDVPRLAAEFKLQNPKSLLSKIIMSIDALHCDPKVTGKKSLKDYASALDKAAAKIKGNP